MTRRKNGTWQEAVTINGKRKFFYGKTKAEVLGKIRAYEEQQETGAFFEDVADEWWEAHSETLTWNSLKPYRPAYKRTVAYFGKTPIKEILPREINRHIEQFAATHADKTVRTQLSVYNLIFRYAVKQGYLLVNPARDLTVPSGLKKTKRHSASPEDIKRVKKSTGLPFGMFAYWAMYTGMRRGELLALEWKDVDLKARTISVTKSLYHQHNKPFIKIPKTETSIGSLPILDALLKKIKPGKGLVFPGADGGYMTRGEFTRAWQKYAQESGVTATPHQFRHVFATMLFEADVPAPEAQALLRHAQLSTTMDIYTDLRAEKMKKIHKKVYAVDIS